MMRILNLKVSRTDVLAVETATAAAFPGHAQQQISGWLLRAGDGITERSNSAAPLGPQLGVLPLAQLREFYAAHGLPVRVLCPDLVVAPESLPGSWQTGPEIMVMTHPLADLPQPAALPGVQVEFAAEPSDQWYELYHFRGQELPREMLEQLRQQITGQMCFAALKRADQVVAITRATLTRDQLGCTWLGYSAVEVRPELRRQGLGTLLGAAVLQWGLAHGAAGAYLQVLATNTAGIKLYQRLGFAEHHRHRYAQLLA